VESWSEQVLMKIGGKPSGPPSDLALSLQIARLTTGRWLRVGHFACKLQHVLLF